MPAGLVRPRASQVPHALNAGDATDGPCARCGDRCTRYGDQGSPLCPRCKGTAQPACDRLGRSSSHGPGTGAVNLDARRDLPPDPPPLEGDPPAVAA